MNFVLTALFLLTSSLARAEDERDALLKEFISKECTYLMGPRIVSRINDGEYEVVGHKPLMGSKTFNPVGSKDFPKQVILLTKRVYGSAGLIEGLIVKLRGNRKVKLANGFDNHLEVYEEAEDCTKIFKQAESLARTRQAIKESKEKKEHDEKAAVLNNSAEKKRKSQSIKESKSKALYE